MIHNTNGHSVKLTRAYAAFDSLPKAHRQALANADHNYSSIQIRSMKIPSHKIAAYIARLDQEKHVADAKLGLVCPGQRLSFSQLEFED